MDGASLQIGAGIDLQLKAPTGERIEQIIRLGFPVSNNEIEYKAILAKIDLAKSISSEKTHQTQRLSTSGGTGERIV